MTIQLDNMIELEKEAKAQTIFYKKKNQTYEEKITYIEKKNKVKMKEYRFQKKNSEVKKNNFKKYSFLKKKNNHSKIHINKKYIN